MPSEGDGYPSFRRGDDGGLDIELTVACNHGDLDPMREGERRRVDMDRGAEAGGLATDVDAVHAPTGRTDEQAVDRQAVVIGAQR